MTNSVSGEPIQRSQHTLHIEQRGKVMVTGVQDVSSFLEDEIVLKIDSGEMVLTGNRLHIAKLLLEEGQLLIDGQIDGVNYLRQGKQEHKHGLLKKLFKA